MSVKYKLSGTTVLLHWLIAFAMIGMLAFGLYLEELPRSPEKAELIGLHKSVGVLVLLFAVIRLGWRIGEGRLEALGNPGVLQRLIAALVLFLLLLGTLLMPLSGIVMSLFNGYPVGLFGLELLPGMAKNEQLAELGKIAHGLGGKVIIAAIALHILGALYHAIIRKDGTTKRMLGRRLKVSET